MKGDRTQLACVRALKATQLGAKCKPIKPVLLLLVSWTAPPLNVLNLDFTEHTMATKEAPASNRDSKSIIPSDTKDSAIADQPLTHDHISTSYTIGGNVLTAPLVDLPYLKTHLRLLRAFKDLRTAVEADRNPCTGEESQWPDLAKALSGSSGSQ